MNQKNPSNLATSIHARLLNLKSEREDFNIILTRYAIERFLYRLSCSKSKSQFVLKGAMLFAVWTGRLQRPTRDVDLLGFGDSSIKHLHTLFRQICQTEVKPDGLEFDSESIEISEVREDQEYEGVRIHLMAHLGKARIPVQIDIGFGDCILPAPETIAYPTLLDFPAPHIRIYPRESVIAEKFEAMVSLGLENSRMKDFYDIDLFASEFDFNGKLLAQAIKATFERRQTSIPKRTPTPLTLRFSQNSLKKTQWKAFLNRSRLEDVSLPLSKVITSLRKFLIPPLKSIAENRSFNLSWTKGDSWK